MACIDSFHDIDQVLVDDDRQVNIKTVTKCQIEDKNNSFSKRSQNLRLMFII